MKFGMPAMWAAWPFWMPCSSLVHTYGWCLATLTTTGCVPKPPKPCIGELQGLRFCMTHIGGRPGHYAKGIRSLLNATRPDVFMCGHSHLLKVQSDPSFGGLYADPGAQVCTDFTENAR